MIAINLLPWRDELNRIRQKRYLSLLTVMAAVTLLCWLLLAWYYQQRLRQQQLDNTFWQQQVQQAQQTQQQLGKLREQEQFYSRQFSFIRQNRLQYNQLLRFMNELVLLIPDGSVLISLEKTGTDLVLSGVTEQAALLEQILQRAEQLAIVQWPVLTVTRVQGASSYFRLRLQLNIRDSLLFTPAEMAVAMPD